MAMQMSFFYAIFHFISVMLSNGNKEVDLNVMTFNIRYDNPKDAPNDWNNRKSHLVDFVHKYNPDVIGFQEVMYHQLLYLSENMTAYSYIGVGRDDGQTKGEYSPLFYRTDKFELNESGSFWLSETPHIAGSKHWANLTRIASWAFLREKTTQQLILCINTHFDHESVEAREKSAQMILEFIQSKAQGAAVILTGDFNTTAESTAYKTLTTNWSNLPNLFDSKTISKKKPTGLTDSFNGFGTSQNSGIIDFVFVNQLVKVKSHIIPSVKSESIYISDHSPVFVQLTVGKKMVNKHSSQASVFNEGKLWKEKGE